MHTVKWVKEAFTCELLVRKNRWSEAIAVRSLAFVESVKGELGSKALNRVLNCIDGAYALREYDGDLASKSEPVGLESTIAWQENPQLCCGSTNEQVQEELCFCRVLKEISEATRATIDQRTRKVGTRRLSATKQ